MKAFKRTALVLCLLLTLFSSPFAYAAETDAQTPETKGETVRVGWYESPFNMTDQFGRRSGFAYEYQQKIAAYTGWTYEYVEASWPELYQMLLNGEIDLMSDVSYTEERAEKMLFSTLPMGDEAYYFCIPADRDVGITADDLSTFNGKRVGVNRDTIQEVLFYEWEQKNGIETEIVELMLDQDEALQMLIDGAVDAFITPDVYGEIQASVPILKIGYSNFYFAVNKDRPDLLRALDAAMNRIQDENRSYNQRLQEKYIDSLIVSVYFPQSDVDWLEEHGTVRVGYRDDYLPFCDADENGELDGALKDFLSEASAVVKNGNLAFEAVPFADVEDALDALRNGEIDCLFPVNFTDHDAEQIGVLTTAKAMETDLYAVVRNDRQRDFLLASAATVALYGNDRSYRTFLMDYFPNWEIRYFESREACYEAVEEKKADCTLMSNYRRNILGGLLEKYKLSTVATGRAISLSFAVRRDEDSLYAILNKVTNLVRDSAIDSALASYSYMEKEFTLQDFLRTHMLPVLCVLLAILTLILLLLIKSRRAERKAKKALRDLEESLGREKKQKRELSATKMKAYTDPLTGVKNKNAYVEATDSLQRRITDGLAPAFAVAVFDVNDLKRVNDTEGHEAGDRHIKNASALICDVFNHSPVYRVGGDEFMAILEGRDYQNRETLKNAFNQTVERNKETGLVVVSAGFADFDPNSDLTFKEVFQRADLLMYQRKKFLKGGREIR